ncbi:MAG: YqgE/AlgH family protein [Nonlabens sp.]|uniref:YqgE/AlgH family protein n=1 Tax=Nonlabens sp. TaxID=1888209 RepID=UPI003EF911DD
MSPTLLKKGNLLVSKPNIIGDESFSRSIILLTEYNEDGVVGFILNKQLDYTLNDLIPGVELEIPVYQGGPVEMDNLYFLHSIPDLIPDSHLITDDIYWGGDFTSVNELLNNNSITSDQIKFFLGYSGWHKNQLTQELDAQTWAIKEGTSAPFVFSEDISDLWKNEMLELGGSYELWSNAPENPSYN